MIIVECFAGQNVLVLGLGRTGKAAARAIQAGGGRVHVWDDNSALRTEARNMDFQVTDPFLIDWKTVSALVMSPGIPHTFPEPPPVALKAKNAGVPIISDVDLLGRTQMAAKYIGITGTNGKSTTTALIGHILTKARQNVEVGGNIGIPVLTLEPLAADGFYVLEMSSYLNELTRSIRFDAAVLLNITPDHLDRHGSMEGYVAAKEMLFHNQRPGSIAVIGLDDARSMRVYHRLKASRVANVVGISSRKQVKGGVYYKDGVFIDDAFDTKAVLLNSSTASGFAPGLHWQNICAAYAVCRHLGFSRSMILENIRSFPGLVHRQQLVSTIDGIMYINDSKATNMASTKEALNNFNDIYWILGGRLKGESLSVLSDFFPKVRKAFLIGEAIQTFSQVLQSADVPFQESGDLEQAVIDARKAALASGISKPTVLLSPACASFDQFDNFEKRGEVFCQLVRDLPGLHMGPQQKEKGRKVLEVA
jgi:UDP-N-acetylmuramoylalanine--D-glutamate ligase